MKTGAGGATLELPPDTEGRFSIWCCEPVCESGRTRDWYNAVSPFCRKAGRAREGMSSYFSASTPGGRKVCMQVLYSRCCGIDVHLESVTACVRVQSDAGEPEIRKKEFATHFQALGHLRFWLMAQQVTCVAMESTGVYWKPVWQALEGHFQLVLANPYEVKNIPGKKTDARDSQRLAELLAHGLIRSSFIPPPQTRELRDLTRYRVKLSEERNRIHNRIHKVLEDACLKLDTVASDILGTSGRAIIQAIIDGQEDAAWLADKAVGRLRSRRADLRLALRGRITDHHRLMLRELLEDWKFVEAKIERLEKAIGSRTDAQTVARLCTIPGVDVITAWTLLAELGSDMQAFASTKHAASWAGLCPGNHESGGKRLSHRTRKGNRWLRRGLCQAAWAASHQKNCYLAAFFYRKAAKHGQRKAIVALAHRLLVIAYCILRDGSSYREAGGDYFDRLRPERTRNRLVQRLERLGYEISLRPSTPAPPVASAVSTAGQTETGATL
jgi:transposase